MDEFTVSANGAQGVVAAPLPRNAAQLFLDQQGMAKAGLEKEAAQPFRQWVVRFDSHIRERMKTKLHRNAIPTALHEGGDGAAVEAVAVVDDVVQGRAC